MKNVLVLTLTLLCILSCKKDYRVSNIPNSAVHYELSINSKLARELNTGGGIIKIQEVNKIGEVLPPNGVVIVRSIDKSNEYYAFDLRCPYEYPTIVELNYKGIDVICPKCDSHYQVVYGTGIPIKGVSRKPLRKYKVHIRGNNLIVTN